MTLNQVILRIRMLALAHKQIRRFKTGIAQDLFADQTAKYPACCLQYTAGNISISGKVITVNFRMFLVDLVHVSEDAKTNEDDVLSDMLSVMVDLVAEINAPQWEDWKISGDNTIQAITEGDNDLYAGWYVDFSLSTMFKQNICQIPTDAFDLPSETNDPNVFPGTELNPVIDLVYTTTGSEGSTLTIPELAGKKILLIVREGGSIYKVSSSPDTVEYTWNDAQIGLGLPVTNAGERFLILYRNY